MEKVQATLMHIISCFMHDTDFQLSNQLTKENWQELYELSKIHSLLPSYILKPLKPTNHF